MLVQFLYLSCLSLCCVALHMMWSLYWLAYVQTQTMPSRWRFFGFILSMLGLHLAEVGCFAVFYQYFASFHDFAEALYFSMVSYATLGYGDLLLPKTLRLVGAGESLIGSLMIGWTVAVLIRYLGHWHHQKQRH